MFLFVTNKIIQEGIQIKMGDKKFYSLQEIAKRWRYTQNSINKLCDVIVREQMALADEDDAFEARCIANKIEDNNLDIKRLHMLVDFQSKILDAFGLVENGIGVWLLSEHMEQQEYLEFMDTGRRGEFPPPMPEIVTDGVSNE